MLNIKYLLLVFICGTASLFAVDQTYKQPYPGQPIPTGQDVQQQKPRPTNPYGAYPIKYYNPFPDQSGSAIQKHYGVPSANSPANPRNMKLYQDNSLPNPTPFPDQSASSIQKFYGPKP